MAYGGAGESQAEHFKVYRVLIRVHISHCHSRLGFYVSSLFYEGVSLSVLYLLNIRSKAAYNDSFLLSTRTLVDSFSPNPICIRLLSKVLSGWIDGFCYITVGFLT